MTLTGKRPPNRDPELQRTELVQDAKALMVQDTKVDIVSPSDKVKRRETEVIYISCSDRLTDRQ